MVDNRLMTMTTMDGRRSMGILLRSHCEPNGSGELKLGWGVSLKQNLQYIYNI